MPSPEEDIRRRILETRSDLFGAPEMDIFHPKYAFAVGLGKTHEDTEQLWALAKEVTDNMNVVEQIMAERKIGRRQALNVAKREHEKQISAIPFPTSLRDKVLEVLYRDGVTDGVKLAATINLMGAKANINEVVAATWSCQKQGWVTFRESHTGAHGSSLARIKLTPVGRTQAIENRGGTPRQSAQRTDGIPMRGYSDSPTQGAVHSVGVDPTDFRNHRTRTRGGEITSERHEPVPYNEYPYGYVCSWDKEAWPCLVAQQRGITAAPKPEVVPVTVARVADPPKQNEKLPAAEVVPKSAEVSIPETPVPSPVAGTQEDSEIDWREMARDELAEVFPERYPLLFKLRGKRSRLEAAAKALEDEGELDLAAATLEKLTYTPEQEEILRLIEELMA